MLRSAKGGPQKSEGGTVGDLSQAVLDSSHQIWLAGLGAFARARQEGTRVFDTLVKQGEQLEHKTRRVATETAAAARGAATAKAKEMQQMAGGTWDKLEQVFEDRVARALSKLGVYTQNDVQKLADRGEALSVAGHELLHPAGSRTLAGARRTRRPKRTPVRARAKASPATGKAKKTAGKR